MPGKIYRVIARGLAFLILFLGIGVLLASRFSSAQEYRAVVDPILGVAIMVLVLLIAFTPHKRNETR